MTLKLDNFGRIVVPKEIRERLGLRAGMDLEIGESPEGLLIKPAHRQPSLVQEGRFLVHTGKLPRGYDMLRAVEDDRDDRMRKLGGA
jgi:AbrB family looped-hinge helix DNA binding protein